MKNKLQPSRSSRRSFLKKSSLLPAIYLTAPSMAGGLISACTGKTGNGAEIGIPMEEVSIGNEQEQIRFGWEDGRITFDLRSGDNRRISGLLSLQLMFYPDERNNMHAHTLDDRIRYESEHLREPLHFLQHKQIMVNSDEEDDRQAVTFIQELEGYRVELNFRSTPGDPYVRSDLRIRNVSDRIQRIMMVRCGFEQVFVNGSPAGEWVSPPESYKNHCFTKGKIADIIDYDLRIATPPCGIVQPVMFIGDVEPKGCALAFSPWLSNYGALILTNKGDISYNIFVDRYLSRQEEHYVGSLLFRTLREGWRKGITRFRKTVPARMGYKVSPNLPGWARHMRTFTFPPRIYPIGDERWMTYFRWAKDMGFNATIGFGWMWYRHKDIICAIKPTANDLPLDAEHGANPESVQNHNRMLHELGMKSTVWFPTTGASNYSEMVKAHPNWFIRNEDGEVRSSWYRNGEPWLVDSNPLEEGYYRYWRSLVFKTIEWGFDGIFLDGVIARSSDAFSWPFPGDPHNGVYRAVQRLRAELDEAGHTEFIIKPESGDYLIIPGAYWMNMPRLDLNQPLPLNKRMPEKLINRHHYFLSKDCPGIEESQITEHLELARRGWPLGMPGNSNIGHYDLTGLSPRDLGEMQVRYFLGSIANTGLNSAHYDPEFDHYDASLDEGVSQDKLALKRQYFQLIKKMNAIREKYTFIAESEFDFDSFRSDDGAVPAFARVKGKQAMLVVGNLSRNAKEVQVKLSNDGEINVNDLDNTIRLEDVINWEKFQLSKNELTRGKALRLKSGEVKAWHIIQE